jgi:hypothetical protein
MRRRRLARALGTFTTASALLAFATASAHAYNPTGGTLVQLGSVPCLMGRGNCAVYP